LYLSDWKPASRPKSLVSCPLPENDRYWDGFSFGTSVIFIHKQNSTPPMRTQSPEVILAGKNSEQSGLQLVLRIYLSSHQRAMPKNGAALWIVVEKKTFISAAVNELEHMGIYRNRHEITNRDKK
jgi:hypothetical protein